MAERVAGSVVIQVDAQTELAEARLKSLQSSLKSLQYTNKDLLGLVPGGNILTEVFKRLTGGVYQLVQGLSASAFRSAAGVFASMASAGYETAESMETARVAFVTFLGDAEEADRLLLKIRKDAMITPFDVSGLAQATQKLLLIERNGLAAEETIQNLGKAIVAAGGGNEQLTNLSSYLQQIGINAKVTQRQLSAFGTAGVDIIGMVAERQGKAIEETKEWLQSISNPYDVIVDAINAAGRIGEFKDVYDEMSGSLEQLKANMQDAIGTFGESVMTLSGLESQIKGVLGALARSFSIFENPETVATFAATIRKLLGSFDGATIVTRAIESITKALGAFNSGQFDNIIVFFKQFFNVLKNFAGVSVIGKTIKLFLDLFSDNHAAEEVRRIATQMASLLKILIEFRLLNKISGYITTFGKACVVAFQSAWTAAITFGGIIASLLGLFGGTSGLFDGLFDGISDYAATVDNAGAKVANTSSKTAAAVSQDASNTTDDIKKKIKDIQAELAKLQAQWVKEMGDLGAFDLKEQLSWYQKFQAEYAAGTKARIERDEHVHDAELAISKEIISKVEEFNKTFNEAMLAAKDYYNMFEYTQASLRRTTASVIEGLRRQNDNMLKYYQNLKKISTMGFDADFMQYVYAEGMDAASEVAGLADATQEQIDEINEMWRTRGQIATDIAVLNTKELKNETLDEIADLQASLKTQVVDVYDTGTLLVQSFTEGIMDSLPTLQDAMARLNSTTSGDASGGGGFITTPELDIDWNDALKLDQYAGALDKLKIDTYDFKDLFSMVWNVIKQNPGLLVGATLMALPKIKHAFNEITLEAGDSTAKAGKKVLSTLSSTGGTAEKTVKTSIRRILKLTNDAGDEATKSAVVTKKELSTLFNNVTTGTLLQTKAGTKQIADVLKEQASKTVNTVKSAADNVKNVEVNKYKNLVKSADAYYKQSIRDSKAYSKLKLQELGYEHKETVYKVKNTFETIRTTSSEFFGTASSLLSDFLTFIPRVIGDTLSGLADIVGKFANSILVVIQNFLRQAIASVATIVQDICDAITSGAPKITSAIRGITKIINQIIDSAASIISRGVKLIMKTVETAAGGIGRSIKALIKPLSDPTLLIGATALVLVATAILELSVAMQALSSVSIEGVLNLALVVTAMVGIVALMTKIPTMTESVLIGAAALAAVGAALAVAAVGLKVASDAIGNIDFGQLAALGAYVAVVGVVMNAFGKVASQVALGAAAAAAIGASLLAVALGLSLASEAVSGIDYSKLLELSIDVAVAGAIMGVLGKFAKFVALGAVVTLAIGVGLLGAAVGLAEASIIARDIDWLGLLELSGAVASTAVILGIVAGFAVFGAVGAIASAVIGGGLLLTAMALAEVGKYVDKIDQGKLDLLTDILRDVSGMLDIITPFAAFGAIGAIASAVIGGGLLVAALALAETSKHVKDIDEDSIGKLEGIIGKASLALTGIGLLSPFSAVGAIVTDIIAGALLAATLALAEIGKHAEELDAADAVNLQKVVDAFKNIDFSGLGGKYADAAKQAANVASSVQSVVDSLSQCVTKLAELADGDSQKVDEYVQQAIRIVESISKIEVGTKNKAKNNRKASEEIAKIAESTKTVIDNISQCVTTLHNLYARVSEKQVDEDVQKAIDIVEKIAEFKGTDDKSSINSNSRFKKAYETLRKSIEDIAKIAEAVSGVTTSIKNIVDILSGFTKEQYDNIDTYIDKCNTIIGKFAKIEAKQENLDKIAENVGNIAKIAESVNTMLTHVKGIVDNIKFFVENQSEYNNIVGTGAHNYITMCNNIIAAFGKLSAKNETENAYANLAKNLGDLATAITNVKTILENVGTVIDLVKAFCQKYNISNRDDKTGSEVDRMVKDINVTLATLTGGHDVNGAWHQGICLPSNMTISSDTATQLGYVKDSLGAIGEIVTAVNGVGKAAPEKLANIDSIIKFIKEKMVELPRTMASYTNEFTTIGDKFATAFINAWSAKYTSAREAGEQMIAFLKGGVEDQYSGLTDVGYTAATKVIDGFTARTNTKPSAYDAGHALQSAMWWGVQDQINNNAMYNQGASIADAEIRGLVDGINVRLPQIASGVKKLGQTTIQKLKDILDIHSPSRVMMEIGGQVSQGLADGITDGLDVVSDAGEALAEAVMGGYDHAIEPLSASAVEARAWTDYEKNNAGLTTGGRTTSIVQNNNIYSDLDMDTAMSNLSWAVARS